MTLFGGHIFRSADGSEISTIAQCTSRVSFRNMVPYLKRSLPDPVPKVLLLDDISFVRLTSRLIVPEVNLSYRSFQ